MHRPTIHPPNKKQPSNQSLNIRNYQPSDLDALRRICLLTGNSGQGAEHLYSNPDLLGDFYAAPYGVLHPELTFVLADEEKVVGYVLGTDDTATFGGRSESEWFPHIREKLSMPAESDTSKDARIIRMIFKGHPRLNRFPEFPAHLHIDLLPEAQSAGWGRKLLDAFCTKLKAQGVAGVHLGVGKRNENAIGFYRHYGFELLEEEEDSLYFGLRL